MGSFPSRGMRVALIVVLLLAALAPKQVRATTFTVNTLDDHDDGVCNSADCTLREALNAAQPPGTCDWGVQHIIQFSVSGTIELDPALGPLPDLRCPLIIDGGGSVAISGRGVVDHAFNAYAWDDSSFATDEIVRGLTFRDFSSYAMGIFVWGFPSGSILVEDSSFLSSPVGIVVEPRIPGSVTTLRGVQVQGASQWGIVVRATSGRVIIDSSTITSCGASSGGEIGGINILRSGNATVTLSHLTVSNNGIGVQVYASPDYSGTSVTELVNSDVGYNADQGVLLRGDGYPVDGVYIGVDSSLNYRQNLIHDNGKQGVLVYGQATGGWIWVNDIYKNAQEGLKVEANGGSVRGVDVRYNFVYDNSGAGIVVRGDVASTLIKGNRVGVNGAFSPRPNGDGPGPESDGGIVLIDGPHDNIVENNHIAYSHYQNILVSGSSDNTIRNNVVWSNHTLVPDGYYGIVLTDESSSNEVKGNIVFGHIAEGIVIMGEGSDGNSVVENKVGAYDLSGTYTGNPEDGNGAGISVLSASFPSDITFPFPVYALTPTGMRPGPEGTVVAGNQVRGNNGDGIILIRTQYDDVEANFVNGNARHGIYVIGSESFTMGRNIIQENGGDGVRVEPFYGDYSAPLDPSDDVLSTMTWFQVNTIEENEGYGLHVLDNVWVPLSHTLSSNLISDNARGDAVKEWLGYVKVEDSHGHPITGLTLRLYRGGDDGDTTPDYVSGSWDPEGRYGPAGFTYEDVSTWWRIVEEEAVSGSVLRYNPYTFGTPDGPLSGFYSWDGEYPNPPTESGGGFLSPPSSGVWRYQYALATYRGEETEEGGEIEGERVCTTYMSLTTPKRWSVSPGGMIPYRLGVRSTCDHDTDLKILMRVPSQIGDVKLKISSGQASFDEKGRVITWTLSLRERGNETMFMNASISQGAPLGSVISLRAEASCDPGCTVASGGSDDPLTVEEFGDPTVRIVQRIEREVLPSQSLSIPYDVGALGRVEVHTEGCESWNLSIEGTRDHEVRRRGRINVRAPGDLMEGESCSIYLTPERVPRFMRVMGVKNLEIRLVPKKYVNITGFLSTETKEVVEGGILAVKALVSNEGTVGANYTLLLRLNGTKFMAATSSPGNLSPRAGELVWSYSVPPHARRHLRVLLSVPNDVNSVVIGGSLVYLWSGGNGSIELGEIEVKVLPRMGRSVSTTVSSPLEKGSVGAIGNLSKSAVVNLTEVPSQGSEDTRYEAPRENSTVEAEGLVHQTNTGGIDSGLEREKEGGRGINSIYFELIRIAALLSMALMLLFLFIPTEEGNRKRIRLRRG